jgi:hypothetical protein
MSENTERSADGPPVPSAAEVLAPEFEQLLRRVGACSPDEKRVLLDRLLRDLIGEQPGREYGLYNPDGTAYLFLVPPEVRRTLAETPEVLAELDRRGKSAGNQTPFRDVIARLESMP